MPRIYFISTRPKVKRHRRRKPFRKRRVNLGAAGARFSKLILSLLLIWALVGGFQYLGANKTANLQKVFSLVAAISDDYRGVLQSGLPHLAAMGGEKTWTASMMVGTLQTAARGKIDDPRLILNNQIPLIRAVEEASAQTVQVSERNPIDLEKDYTSLNLDPESVPAGSIDEALGGNDEYQREKPAVAIYNTHNAETYLPTHGTERVDGRNGGVVEVAAVLAETLENKYGVKVARSTEIHDFPIYDRSYGNSLRTAQALLRANSSVQMVFDVHRDAGVPIADTVEIAGKSAAQILLVVGNLVRWEGQPQGRGNMEFAETIKDKLDELYPGLVKGIRVKAGRYNQHLHPHSLLVEFGNSHNSQEEAEYSAQLFARAVAEVLEELRQASTL